MDNDWLVKNFSRHDFIDSEIENIENEISRLIVSPIPFDKYDYIMLVAAGVTGGLFDVVMGRPGAGYDGADPDGVVGKFKEPTIKNNSFLGLGEQLKQFDLKNNPIDTHVPGAPVGDHRLFSYGHDLFRALQSIQLILTGHGDIGISANELGGVLSRGVSPDGYTPPDAVWKAIIVLTLHLYKDFWSPRSLPIPGSTLIADLNDHNMPDFIDSLTNENDFNLRTLSAQTLSVASIEVIIGIYMWVRYYKSEFSKEQVTFKKQKVLLASHAIAMAFNMGKIIVTQNPYFLNLPQVIRMAKLAFNIVVENSNQIHRSKESAMLSQIKSQLQMQKTLVLLSDAYYVQNELIITADNNLAEIYRLAYDNEARTKYAISDLRHRLAQI